MRQVVSNGWRGTRHIAQVIRDLHGKRSLRSARMVREVFVDILAKHAVYISTSMSSSIRLRCYFSRVSGIAGRLNPPLKLVPERPS